MPLYIEVVRDEGRLTVGLLDGTAVECEIE